MLRGILFPTSADLKIFLVSPFFFFFFFLRHGEVVMSALHSGGTGPGVNYG